MSEQQSEIAVGKLEDSIFSCSICNYDYEEHNRNKPQVYEIKMTRFFTNGSQSESFRLCNEHLKELYKKIRLLVQEKIDELEKSSYEVMNNKAVPTKAEEMEWLLRYGDEQEILKNRLYIAHIVNLYINQSSD